MKNKGFPSLPIGRECLITEKNRPPITAPRRAVCTSIEIFGYIKPANIAPNRVDKDTMKLTFFDGCGLTGNVLTAVNITMGMNKIINSFRPCLEKSTIIIPSMK